MYVGIVPTFFGNMRIAQDLSISQVRKASTSWTVRSAARFTRGCSGRTRLGPDRRHERETRPLSFLGYRRAAGPCRSQRRWDGKMGVKWPKRGGKIATFAGTCYVTIYDVTPLFACCCVNYRRKERRETNSHNHLFIKNLRRKHGFPDSRTAGKT